MDKVGVLIISKSLSSSAIIDTLLRSEKYQPEFYIIEKQANPLNQKRAKVRTIAPDLTIPEILRFTRKHAKEIAFGLTDTEDFVTAGGRDQVERETGVPMLCVTQKYAIERSKADQRLLFKDIWPEVNPRYTIFDPKVTHEEKAISELRRLNEEYGGVVIKPDAPARGAGVGVWGSDFTTEEEMKAFFHNVYSKGRVVVEERIEGEESSFQAFSDGRHFIVTPQTRDYKRALDNNQGRLTGGMGSYRAPTPWLPFLQASKWEQIVEAEKKAFERWKGRGSNPALRGIVLYDAFMHDGDNPRILERNSRGGNTEQINILTTIIEDFIDVCHRIIDGTLKSIRFSNRASVVTCAVPLSYGIPLAEHPQDGRIDLTDAYSLEEKYGGDLRIFPMDVQTRNETTFIGSSRSVAVLGLGKSIEDARRMSLEGVTALHGPLRWRNDIGSAADIQRSLNHMRMLSSKQNKMTIAS
jgi:phosphoribosylamine---glycine ligase